MIQGKFFFANGILFEKIYDYEPNLSLYLGKILYLMCHQQELDQKRNTPNSFFRGIIGCILPVHTLIHRQI